jgi:hypothetical protein
MSNLHLAVDLIMAIVPHSTRYQAERAVVDEFLVRTPNLRAFLIPPTLSAKHVNSSRNNFRFKI